MVVKFDRLDLMILSELRNDCKQSIRRLAKKLGTHPNTVMNRIKSLEKKEIIKGYLAAIDYSKLGYTVQAIIFMQITADARKDWDLLNDLKKLPEIISMYTMAGKYDVMLIVRTKSTSDLRELIRRIAKLPCTERTQTNSILEEMKSGYKFNPLNVYSIRK